MTRAAQGDSVQLVTAGTAATSKPWRGGAAVLLIDNLSGTPSLEIQTPSGAWVAAHDLNTGGVVTGGATALMFNLMLPACNARLSAGGGTMNAWLIGV
jgi:hypothetical protein